jgi:hypothetical protein
MQMPLRLLPEAQVPGSAANLRHRVLFFLFFFFLLLSLVVCVRL